MAVLTHRGLHVTSTEQGPGHVVAVIPALNEERFIGSVVLATLEYVHKVIVVDDGSSDKTAALAAAAGAVVLRFEHNRGKAAALLAGFNTALSFNPVAVVTLDADAQHDPSEIPNVVAPILAGDADVTVGSRLMDPRLRTAVPSWRLFGQRVLNAITNRLSGTTLSDTQSGFRAFGLGALSTMQLSTRGLSVESEMQFQFRPNGWRVLEVPIHVQYRDGNKRNPVAHGVQVLNSIIGLVTRRQPLTYLSVPGLTLALLGVAIGVHVAEVVVHTGILPVGSAVLTSLLVTVGLLFVVTGVLLHSIGVFVDTLGVKVTEALRSTDGMGNAR